MQTDRTLIDWNKALWMSRLILFLGFFGWVTLSPWRPANLAAADLGADKDWSVYLGDNSRSQFSRLKQIQRSNVHLLEKVWVCETKDARPSSQIQCNPLIIDGVLYGTTPRLKLFALNAATGDELWRFDPFSNAVGDGTPGVNRGLVHWKQGQDARILFAADHFLYAVDVRTGRPVLDFGVNGKVNLKDGLGRDVSKLSVLSNTPGVVFQNLLILGTSVGEGPGPAAPGHIRAYDLRSGELIWIFHTIPQPGEFGHDTWPPEAWTYVGGANCWSGMAVDEERGLVFCPTGSPTYDFWGGDRIGANLFGNCLLALNARTGKRVWHFQFVHHDLWDRDLPAPPNLLTVRQQGKTIDAVAQVTKSGHVFLLDRETGVPLFPVEEQLVPPSDMPGESAWPTQPIPVKPAPFSRQVFSANLITDISPESRRQILDRFVQLRPHVPFMPPSREGTIIFPGFDGGGEWGGAAADLEKGVLYVNGNEMAWVQELVDTSRGDAPVSSGRGIYQQICAACHGLNREGDPQRTFPTLVGIENKMNKSDIIRLLQTGRGVMPSVAFLSSPQQDAVAGYLLGEEASDSVDRDGAGEKGDDLVGSPFTHTGYNRWLDSNGYPAVKPPWGTLNAIDLNTGEYVWKVPLGEFPELTAKGIPPTGAENYGGPIVTSGGVIFIGASRDEMFRAFDQRSGSILWQTKLPAGGYATPATYMADGRQFVVIACGGGKMGTRSGDTYVAFALKQ